tara:strand:+ start:49 stop:768 length:720 start_codon:yes stop_codon:yes gene_type:complete
MAKNQSLLAKSKKSLFNLSSQGNYSDIPGMMSLATRYSSDRSGQALPGGIPPPIARTITVADVLAAQQAWGNAVIAIGEAYGENQNLQAATDLAYEILSSAYNYDYGEVFFRPTLTTHPTTFRNTKESALCYFVGGCSGTYAGDTGFALNRWTNVTFNNYPGATAGQAIGIITTAGSDIGIMTQDNLAFTMGYVTFSGSPTYVGTQPVQVDKTFGYVKNYDGSVRIVLHFSALTNNPNN